MIQPTPSGTRDVLPDEMRELRAISDQLRAVFDQAGYGEVQTPALEYERVLEAAGDLADALPAYRVFDEEGQVLVLRSDMTVPIARVAATRYAEVEPPLRFSYLAHSYRGVRPQRGQSREFLQAGIELIGAPAPEGTAEALIVLCEALTATGLRDFRVGLGDAALFPALLESHEVPEGARERAIHELGTRDFVGLERELRGCGLSDAQVSDLLATLRRRGAEDVLDGEPAALSGLRSVRELLPDAVAERVIFDLGLSRRLGYYTGAIFEVYDPTVGVPLGGGGRYDELLGRFGRPLPAAGFALNVERVHLAVAGEER
jgi:ATP phosphoribosyltransferase regulatory subunit